MMKKQKMVDAEKRVMPAVSGGARHRTGHGRACYCSGRCNIDDKQNKRRGALRRWRRQMTGLAAGVTALMCLLTLWPAQAQAAELPIQSRAALLMEKTTGQVLYARNEHEQLEPASVTKVMTLLLTMEAIDSGTIGYDDVVTVSTYAAGMGGSQVYLAEGEQITVEELLKAVCVASGNDAAAALAEKVAGISDRFVEKMNQRAAELGMNDTHFANCTGLTAEGHVTSAHDIAVMSRELILKHPDIRRFTTIWMDTIRGGAFQLANTNKLIRFYDGATGLKTGYTASAGYCISATAERDGMELIAVVMKGPDRDTRNNDAKTLLNYGFSTYALVTAMPEQPLMPVPVDMGTADTVQPVLASEGNTVLVEREKAGMLERKVTLEPRVTAPVAAGQPLGELTVLDGDTVLLTAPITAGEDVMRRSWGQVFTQLLRLAVFAG